MWLFIPVLAAIKTGKVLFTGTMGKLRQYRSVPRWKCPYNDTAPRAESTSRPLNIRQQLNIDSRLERRRIIPWWIKMKWQEKEERWKGGWVKQINQGNRQLGKAFFWPCCPWIPSEPRLSRSHSFLRGSLWITRMGHDSRHRKKEQGLFCFQWFCFASNPPRIIVTERGGG